MHLCHDNENITSCKYHKMSKVIFSAMEKSAKLFFVHSLSGHLDYKKGGRVGLNISIFVLCYSMCHRGIKIMAFSRVVWGGDQNVVFSEKANIKAT